jgi:endonuclease/exonuclease/phosphatase family metal-dependent hydrolase
VWEYNKNLSAVAKVIKQEKPDILLLQEIRSNGIQTIKNSLGKLYSNGILHIAYGPKIMQAVISRYALKEIEASPEKARAQKVIINTPYGFISVINIHAYKYGWKHRHLQIKKLLEEEIIAEKGPLILGGDFNTNEQSQSYQMVNKYLQNAHWRVGCGFGFTYPARLSFSRKKFPIFPMIRIDHIFYNNHFIKHSARTIYESGGSDHFPVIADFFFRPKP